MDGVVSGMTESRNSMQEILLTLGNRMRSLREGKEMSQETFADISPSHGNSKASGGEQLFAPPGV